MGKGLQLKIEATPAGAVVHLKGDVDEYADASIARLQSLAGEELRINFRDVGTINSTGIRHWHSLLRSLPESRKVIYEACPLSVLEAIAMVPALTQSATVESVHLSVGCRGCGTRNAITPKIPRGAGVPIPGPTCTRCGAALTLDADTQELVESIRRDGGR